VAQVRAKGTNRQNDRRIDAFLSSHKKNAAAKRKLFDGGGMYLTVTRAGTAVWRLKYRVGGKERLCSLGTYPATGLAAARAGRDEMRQVLRAGGDPVTDRRLRRADATDAAGCTFATVMKDWLKLRRGDWCALHYNRASRALERDVVPALGSLPISEITPAMIAPVIEAIAARGAGATATKVLQHCSRIFMFAAAHGLRRDNPAEPVRELLPKKRAVGRRSALLEWDELGDLLRRADAANLSPSVKMAHRLCAFTATRIGNVVTAEWSEFDLEAEIPTWTIPRSKMKVQDRDRPHVIVLGPTIAAELREWRRQMVGKRYVFPSPTGGAHITPESIEKAYRVTLGLANRHSPHGWRAAFATLARDNKFSREVVELTLDHIHDNAVARAYDRGERLDDRIRLMRWWGTQLDRAQSSIKPRAERGLRLA
jgi:integrase